MKKTEQRWGRMRMEMADSRDCRGEAWGGAGPGQLEL